MLNSIFASELKHKQMENVANEIRQELAQTKNMISSNGAVLQHNTDVFSKGPTESKANNLENNDGSVKALYSKVSSHLYEKGMPILNTLAVDVEEARVISEADEQGMENLEASIKTEFATLEHKEMEATNSKIEKELQTASKIYLQAKTRFDQIKGEYELIANSVKRFKPVIKFKSAIAYYALLIFIGVCEIPLNKVIFQRFGESDMITMIMAGTLAIAVPVIAHFIGMFWKQRGEMKDYAWKAITMTSIFLATNVGLGIFRANVLTEIIQSTGQTVTQSDFILNICIFVGITTILFLIGVIAAYFRHDESYKLEHSYANFKEERPKYEAARDAFASVEAQCRQDYLESRTKLKNKYAETIGKVMDRPLESLKKYNEKMAAYERALETARGLEKLIQSEFEYITAALNLKSTKLETNFTDLKEFFIQK